MATANLASDQVAATCRRHSKIVVLLCLISSTAIVKILTGSALVLAANAQQQQLQQAINSSSIEQHKQSKQQQRGRAPAVAHDVELLFHSHENAAEAEVVGSRTDDSCKGKSNARSQRHRLEPAASLSSSLLRAYIRTNNMRAYHLDLHSYRPEVIFSGDPEFVNSRSSAHLRRCKQHLNHYQSLLKAFKETDPMDATESLDSLKLADTFGRPDAGLLEGHQFWLGSYERCLEFKGLLPKTEKADSIANEDDQLVSSANTLKQTTHINGQYCLGLAQFPSWNPADTKTSIKIGLCLPETCTSSMLNENTDLFNATEEMMKYHLGGDGMPFNKLRLRSVYCLPHETSHIRQYSFSSKLFISLMSLFVVGSIYATISDYLGSKTRAGSLMPKLILTGKESGSNKSAQQLMSSSSPFPATPILSPNANDANLEKKNQKTGEECDKECSLNKVASDNNDQVDSNQQKSQFKLVSIDEERSWRNILVESFSLLRNLEKLTKGDTRKSHEEVERGHFDRQVFFNSIRGIKCVGLIWIVAAHTFLVGPITHRNMINIDNLTKTYLANVYLTAHLMVDSFFALSGLLASYLIFKNGIHKVKLHHWITMTVHRYWRLTPVYLICYWFAKSMGHLNNSGPLWDYATAAQSPRLNCANESWLVALFQFSDFKSPKLHCVPFAWFIANGFKFWILTPIFLIAIYKSVKHGYALVCGVIFANIALVFSLALNSNVDMKSVIEFKPESADNMLNNMDDIYTRPYSRIGAYLVGLLAGHLFYKIDLEQQLNQRRQLDLSEKSKFLIWSLFSITVIALTFVIKIAGGIPMEESAIPWVFSFCSAIIRPLWALCTCWLVFGLAHGQARWLAKFLCASGWSFLAKLSFSAYLVQGEVIANLYLAASYSMPYTYTDMISRPLIASAATIAVAFLLAMFVEYPLVGIEELILPAKHSKAAVSVPGCSKLAVDESGNELAKVIQEQNKENKICKYNVPSPIQKGICKGEAKSKDL